MSDGNQSEEAKESNLFSNEFLFDFFKYCFI